MPSSPNLFMLESQTLRKHLNQENALVAFKAGSHVSINIRTKE